MMVCKGVCIYVWRHFVWRQIQMLLRRCSTNDCCVIMMEYTNYFIMSNYLMLVFTCDIKDVHLMLGGQLSQKLNCPEFVPILKNWTFDHHHFKNVIASMCANKRCILKGCYFKPSNINMFYNTPLSGKKHLRRKWNRLLGWQRPQDWAIV